MKNCKCAGTRKIPVEYGGTTCLHFMYSSEVQVSETADSHKRTETGFFESFSMYTTGGHSPYKPLRDGYEGWHDKLNGGIVC